MFHYMKLYLYPSQALNLLIDIALKTTQHTITNAVVPTSTLNVDVSLEQNVLYYDLCKPEMQNRLIRMITYWIYKFKLFVFFNQM